MELYPANLINYVSNAPRELIPVTDIRNQPGDPPASSPSPQVTFSELLGIIEGAWFIGGTAAAVYVTSQTGAYPLSPFVEVTNIRGQEISNSMLETLRPLALTYTGNIIPLVPTFPLFQLIDHSKHPKLGYGLIALGSAVQIGGALYMVNANNDLKEMPIHPYLEDDLAFQSKFAAGILIFITPITIKAIKELIE